VSLRVFLISKYINLMLSTTHRCSQGIFLYILKMFILQGIIETNINCGGQEYEYL